MCFLLRAAGKAGGAQGGGEGRLPLGTPGPARTRAPSAPLREHSVGSLGEAGRCLGRQGTRRQNKLQGCAEDQEKQVYRQLKPSTWSPAPGQQGSPGGGIKGEPTLARPHARVYENQAGAPQPRGRGPPGADTEESSIKSMREVRDTQGGDGSNTGLRRRLSSRRKAFTGPRAGAIPLQPVPYALLQAQFNQGHVHHSSHIQLLQDKGS